MANLKLGQLLPVCCFQLLLLLLSACAFAAVLATIVGCCRGHCRNFNQLWWPTKKKKQAKDNFEGSKKIKDIGGRKEKGSALKQRILCALQFFDDLENTL